MITIHEKAELIARDYLCSECHSYLRIRPLYRRENGTLIAEVFCPRGHDNGFIHQAEARKLEDERNWEKLNELHKRMLKDLGWIDE